MCFFKLFHSQNTYTNQHANISNIEKIHIQINMQSYNYLPLFSCLHKYNLQKV